MDFEWKNPPNNVEGGLYIISLLISLISARKPLLTLAISLLLSKPPQLYLPLLYVLLYYSRAYRLGVSEADFRRYNI